MDEIKKNEQAGSKIKTRQGSGYLKQLYSTAKTTAGTTHSHLKNLTTFLVNFVPIDKVDASELQVRVHFDEAEISALALSIKDHGVLQPILLVHDGDARHSGVITHQGFLIREGNQYFLRHASSSGYIRSNDLFKYLNNLQKQKTHWPVKGVNLNQLSDSSSSTNRLSETM